MKTAIVDRDPVPSGDRRAPYANGDMAAVAAAVTDGVPPFVGRSRNTPAAMRSVRVAACRIPQDYSGAAH